MKDDKSLLKKPEDQINDNYLIVWKKTDEAVIAFIEAVDVAMRTFKSFGFIQPALKELESSSDILKSVEDIQDQIEECKEADSLSEALEIMEDLADEYEFIDEIFSYINDIPEDVRILIFDKVTEDIEEDIVNFVEDTLIPVRNAACYLYDVLTHAT